MGNSKYNIFPNFYDLSKNTMKIVTYQDTKIPLFCHHAKSHHGYIQNIHYYSK